MIYLLLFNKVTIFKKEFPDHLICQFWKEFLHEYGSLPRKSKYQSSFPFSDCL